MNTGRLCRLCYLLSAILLLTGSGQAAEFILLPSAGEKIEYNDNLFIAPDNAPANQKTHDIISTTSIGSHLLSTTERASLDMTARIDQLLYKDNRDLNSTDQFYKAALRYSCTPNLLVSLRGTYIRDSRFDREFFTSGLVVNSARAESSSGGFTADYSLTQKTVASLSYDHGRYWYRSDNFSDMAYDSASLSFVRDLADFLKNIKGRFTLGYSGYSYTGLEVDNYEATTGFDYAVHEKWKFLLDLGGRYTESHFQTLRIVGVSGPLIFMSQDNVTSTGSAGVGHATLTYTGEATTGNVTASRDVMPAYGSLGTVERNLVTANVSRRFTYELSGSLDLGYFWNKSRAGQLAATPLDYESFYGTAGLRYQFSKDMYLEGSYSLAVIDNKNATATGRRNLFLLRFFVQHRLVE